MKKIIAKKELSILVLLTLMLISILVVNGKLTSNSENRELPKVVFYVS